MLLACDLMTPNPRTVREDACLGDAIELLQSLDVRHLPVIDEEGALVGMISDRDLRVFQVDQAWLRQRVATRMTSDVVSVDTETDVAAIVDLMLDNKIGAVAVVDGDGELVGIVSYVDVLREVATAIH